MAFTSIYSETGSVDIVADAQDPNAAPPPDTRVFYFNPSNRVDSPNSFVTSSVIVAVETGTSLVVELWARDERTGKERWWMVGTTTVTAAAGATFMNPIPGAKHYLRVKTNNGNVKNYMVGVR